MKRRTVSLFYLISFMPFLWCQEKAPLQPDLFLQHLANEQKLALWLEQNESYPFHWLVDHANTDGLSIKIDENAIPLHCQTVLGFLCQNPHNHINELVDAKTPLDNALKQFPSDAQFINDLQRFGGQQTKHYKVSSFVELLEKLSTEEELIRNKIITVSLEGQGVPSNEQLEILGTYNIQALNLTYSAANSPKAMQDSADALGNLTNLQKLTLEHYSFLASQESMQHLTNALEKLQNLHTLDLSLYCLDKLPQESMHQLTDTLCRLQSLRFFTLSIGEEMKRLKHLSLEQMFSMYGSKKSSPSVF